MQYNQANKILGKKKNSIHTWGKKKRKAERERRRETRGKEMSACDKAVGPVILRQ